MIVVLPCNTLVVVPVDAKKMRLAPEPALSMTSSSHHQNDRSVLSPSATCMVRPVAQLLPCSKLLVGPPPDLQARQ